MTGKAPGLGDGLHRLPVRVAERLSERLGQQMIADNRGGASTVIAPQAAFAAHISSGLVRFRNLVRAAGIPVE